MSRKIQYYGGEPSPSFPGLKNFELLRRKGFWYVGKKSFYQFLFPFFYRIVKHGGFCYNGKTLAYFNHAYNNAFANERTVEIAIALDAIKSYESKSILEVGNVLSHYVSDAHWDVVDKYEAGSGVINLDILSYDPGKLYNLIISISTIEHIGYDEKPQDPDKIKAALLHMQSLLADGGMMLVTFPLGWNPHLDASFSGGKLPLNIELMERQTWYNTWQLIKMDVIPPFKLGTYLGADYLAVGTHLKPPKLPTHDNTTE